MASTNKAVVERTHGGAVASRMTPAQQLERSVMSCMLWEDEHYEDGVTVAQRIKDLVAQVPACDVARIAIRAKVDMKLRHAPLFLARELVRKPTGRPYFSDVAQAVFTRADDITEFLSLYWLDEPNAPLAKQVRRHVGDAFRRFDEYQLAKYDGGTGKAVKLRDAIRLLRPKPGSPEQSELWRKLVKGELRTPDTWEVALSGGADKRATFTRLMETKKLGTLAFIRNLRNMQQAGVPRDVVRAYADTAPVDRILPFQFIAAAQHVPAWEDVIEGMMLRCLADAPKLLGRTILVVDTSGSMQAKISGKSEMSRRDVAAALAILAREVCQEVDIFCTAGCDTRQVAATMRIPPRRGFALSSFMTGREVYGKIGGGGIFLVQTMQQVKKEAAAADRVIVFTDEQDCDHKLRPDTAELLGKRNYLVNIASAKNGIGYRHWTHIDGWSEKVIDYILAAETLPTQ